MPRAARNGVGESIGAGKKCLEDRVKKANADGDPYLTPQIFVEFD